VQFESKSKLQTLKSMKAGNPSLVEFIRDTIRRCGPVTFEWFMEQALYHSELGYYSSGRCAIGRRGDYFTNVSVGPLFGRLLAAQFTEMWESFGRPDDFVIVEQGAHHGDFARDVLGAVRERAPDFFSTLRYWIIEPFPVLRERQGEALRDFSEKLTWEKSLIDLEPFCGVHFSNELLDAMPVHLISRVAQASSLRRIGSQAGSLCYSDAGWQERCVVESGAGFGFVTAPITDAELRLHLNTIPRHLNGPYETEVNLAALKWIASLAQKLIRGYVLAVDYGYSRDDFYAPERSSGTLQCYAHHRRIRSPFTDIGDADITAHVDWTSVAERGGECGLSINGFTDQHHFITGLISRLAQGEFAGEIEPRARRALQTLLHPEFLGTAFQFLALAKNAPDQQLSGFKFAREPRSALGL
jgi:SAM-dependent MidA family methyltransferase